MIDTPAPATLSRTGRVRAIAVGLNAAGITAGTNGDHLTGLDVTATAIPPGRACTQIMLDEDGYAEIRWYTNPDAPPEQITASIARILDAVTAASSALAPAPAPPADSQ
jgi:hypothetical protein